MLTERAIIDGIGLIIGGVAGCIIGVLLVIVFKIDWMWLILSISGMIIGYIIADKYFYKPNKV